MARKNTINLPAGLHFCRNIVTLYSMCGFAKHIVTCVASVVLALCLADALGMYDCRYEPVAEPEIEKPAETVRRARLLFAGDVMCHMPQVIAARSDSGYDFKGSFAGVKPYFDRADMAIVNLETTVSSNGRYSGYPSFSSPPELIDALHWLGVDVALLANNHCCDRGRRGISSTIDKLDGCRIAHTGVFRSPEEYSSTNPLRFEIDSISFAMLNYTYGTNGLPVPAGATVNRIDTVMMARDLAAVDRAETDCIVVCMHWGTEYERRPNHGQRMLADFLRRYGADLIVGSHPHVIQPCEYDSTHAVFYSLGNFVSNQRRRYCDGGLLAGVEVIKRIGRSGDPQRRPVSVRYAVQTTPVWVALPDYRILPPEVGDTIALSPFGRAAYERFMADTRELLQKGV